jgi:hypothetical protein
MRNCLTGRRLVTDGDVAHTSELPRWSAHRVAEAATLHNRKLLQKDMFSVPQLISLHSPKVPDNLHLVVTACEMIYTLEKPEMPAASFRDAE